MRVLAFGTYQRDYPRNAQVRVCLRTAGIEVAERHFPVWDGSRESWSAGPAALARLLVAESRLALANPGDADVLLVGYPGHLDMKAARRVARGRPVVFDPLVSLFDTLVADRRRFDAGSPAGRAVLAIDRAAFRAADLVVADTEAQATFYAEFFDIPRARLAICFVGASDRLFQPAARQRVNPFHVLFVGKLIPLHGLETILAAANLRPEIPFRIVGSGQLSDRLRQAPRNVSHVSWVDYEHLPAELHAAGCALGIFGTSNKALRVIPNKAYQALACATPLVTADTPAARELLRDGVDAVLVPPGDPERLADAVRRLAEDASLADRIGKAGRATYEARASERVLGQAWKASLEALVTA